MSDLVPALRCSTCRCKLCGNPIVHLVGRDESFCPCCRLVCEHRMAFARVQAMARPISPRGAE